LAAASGAASASVARSSVRTGEAMVVIAAVNPRLRRHFSASAAFELRDEEDLAARADLLEIGRLVVDRAVNRDRGLFLEVLAEPRMEPVERLDHVAHRRRLDIEFALAVGIAAGEPARQDDVRDAPGTGLVGRLLGDAAG